MKRKIFIVIDSNCGEPDVYMDINSAVEAMKEELEYHVDRWGYEKEELERAYAELDEDVEKNGDYNFGTYIGELSVNCYVNEIEI